MKKLTNLKGAQTLSAQQQKEINGGANPIIITCGIGCVGKSHGDRCFASGNCNCPGRCANSTSSGCVPF